MWLFTKKRAMRCFACGLYSLMLWGGAVYAADKATIAVFVAHEHTLKTLSVAELKLIYWRKKTYWANGKRIHPVNLPADHSLRLLFSGSLLGSPPNAQNDYWNGLYFHGVSPPHVVQSEEAAIRYVQETQGSIGYADACKLDDRVKPVYWISPDGEISQEPPRLDCN